MGESRFTATLTGERQITLPRGLCERLGLHRGDTVTLVEDEAGVHIEKADDGTGDEGVAVESSPFDEWYGYLSHIESTSDELFEELRGRKIGEVPGEDAD